MLDRKWTPVWGALLLALALLACKKKRTPDPTPASTPTASPTAARASELQTKVKQRLSAIAALAKKAKSEPAVKSDRPFKEKLEKTAFISLGDKWLEDTHHATAENELELDHTTLALCDYEKDKTEPTADELRYREECTSWKYVAVIRPRRIVMPKIQMESKTFDPGDVQGDVLLFEIDSGEIKGRYPMHITNSDKLTWFEGKPESDWLAEAKRDLVENVRGVIAERLQHERDSMGK